MNQDIKSIYDKGNFAVSSHLRSLFVLDYDLCFCEVEIHDRDPSDVSLSVSSNGISVQLFGDRITSPSLNSIDDEQILSLLRACFEYAAPIHPRDIHPDYPVCLGRNNPYKRPCFVYMDIDELYVLPEPHMFGAYICNSRGFGAFCFPKAMKRVML